MSKIAKIPLVPPKVNLQRRIPQHYISFTYAHILKIAYLSYCIKKQCSNNNCNNNDNNNNHNNSFVFCFSISNFVFFLFCLLQGKIPTNACTICFSIKM